MRIPRMIIVGLLGLGLPTALFVGLAFGLQTHATNASQGPDPQGAVASQTALGTAFTYQGYLEEGSVPADGEYDLHFRLFDAESGGGQIGNAVVYENITVSKGEFAVALDFSESAFTGGPGWLEIGVRPGSSSETFTTLSPRQPLRPVPYALGLRPGAMISGTNTALTLTSGSGHGLYVGSAGDDGVFVDSAGRYGLRVDAASSHGIRIGTAGMNGVCVDSAAVYGFHVGWAESDGLRVSGTGSDGVEVQSATGHGVRIGSVGMSGVYVDQASGTGLQVYSATLDGLKVVAAGEEGLQVTDAGVAGVHVVAAGSDFFRAGQAADLKFRVANDGAAYADGGWQGAADFAELMTTEAEPQMYEPGDVLVISTAADRAVSRSTEPYSTLVIGVYSEHPGFVGSSHVMAGQQEDEIPVAVLGIVPCKVSSENGPIRRGDLLVTSSTPGHAMRADNPPPGTILGKALEPLDASSGNGLIKVLVTLQ